MSKTMILLITIVVLILLSVGKYISVKNTLVAKNEAVRSTWSRRSRVLPNKNRRSMAKSRKRVRNCCQQVLQPTR